MTERAQTLRNEAGFSSTTRGYFFFIQINWTYCTDSWLAQILKLGLLLLSIAVRYEKKRKRELCVLTSHVSENIVWGHPIGYEIVCLEGKFLPSWFFYMKRSTSNTRKNVRAPTLPWENATYRSLSFRDAAQGMMWRYEWFDSGTQSATGKYASRHCGSLIQSSISVKQHPVYEAKDATMGANYSKTKRG